MRIYFLCLFLITAISQSQAQTYPLPFKPELYGKIEINLPCKIEDLRFKSPIVLRCEDHESAEADQDRKIFEGLAEEGSIAYGDEDTNVENPSPFHFGFDSEIKDFFQAILTEAQVQRMVLELKSLKLDEREVFEKQLMTAYLPDFFLQAQNSPFFNQIMDGVKEDPAYGELDPIVQRVKGILTDKKNSIIDVRNKILDLKKEPAFDFLSPLRFFQIFNFINKKYISKFTANILAAKNRELDIVPKTMGELAKRIDEMEKRNLWKKTIDLTTSDFFLESLLTEWRSLYFVKNTLQRYCFFSERERPIFLQMGEDHCEEVARMFQLVSKQIPVQITAAGNISALSLGIQSKVLPPDQKCLEKGP